MISPEIIQIASDTSNCGIRENSNLIATSKNKICGDIITVEIEILNNKIERMSYDTESCVFCQASASLLAKIIKRSNVVNLRNDIELINLSFKGKKMILKRKYKPFRKLFQQKYKERFNCILLPFNALLKVVNNAI
ncbi:iron-sulfur cluster assembly scaffold protein [Pelagibacteraceae bacterium]|jgi:nitrogen fixation NifU-like protein|nr:iron-sulfur cluster assembly scaffold protein [Pelagibacteraceae bacterium]